LDNAIKWSPVKGSINIAISQEDRSWLFSVSDQGPGIPESLKDEIFKPFVAFGSETKSGSGLGLSIAKDILRAFKGSIWVEDNKPRGAIFYLTFPMLVDHKMNG
jgi:two-component system sensor histidine kinase CiaH